MLEVGRIGYYVGGSQECRAEKGHAQKGEGEGAVMEEIRVGLWTTNVASGLALVLSSSYLQML